jgi:multidrug resistance efflux pump
MLTASLAHAEGSIEQLRAEIAQRKSAIAQMQAEGKPTGRFEMTVFRLTRELERKLADKDMLDAGSR